MTAKRKPNPRAPKPKAQQATSRQRIYREKCKELAAQYRVQGAFSSLRMIADAINTNFGPEGDEPLPGFRKVSHHLVHTLISEAIKESIDPLLKDELREVELGQLNALLAAAMGPALAGSTMHMTLVMQLQEKIAKLTGHRDAETEGGGASVTQIFINGALADA